MTGESKSNRWLLYCPLIAGLLLLLIYGALWRGGAHQMRQSIETWAEDQRAAGLTVSYDKIATKGFPFFLRGAISNVVVSDEAWSWRAPLLHIDALPLSPDRLIFSAREPHILELGDFGTWRITAPDGRASIANDADRLWILDIESGPGRLERIDGDEVLTAERFLLTMAPSAIEVDRLEASLTADSVTVQSLAGAPLIDVTSVAAAIGVNNVSAFAGGADIWRNAGGAIDIEPVVVEAEGATMRLAGRLSIDGAGYSTGKLDAELVNAGAVALLLGELGVMTEAEAETAAASLTLAAIAGGGKIAAPLVFKNGEATIAGIRVADLPKFE